MDLVESIASTLVGALVGAGLTHHFWVRQKLMEIRGAYDQELRTQRLTAYQALWLNCQPLAQFSPDEDVRYTDVVGMGRKLREWYFTTGGLVLTHRARDLYMFFQETLDRVAQEASTPNAVLRAKAERLSQAQVNKSRTALGLDVGDPPLEREAWQRWLDRLQRTLEKHRFGNDAGTDFVVLQTIASRLRTLLALEVKTREPSVLDAADDTGLEPEARP